MRILIVNSNMHIGGVQKALVNLLWNIHERYDITLLLLYPGGKLLRELPPDVKVIGGESAYRFLGMTGADARNRLSDRVGRVFFGGVSRVFGRSAAVRIMALGQKPLTGYDVAISYFHNGGDKVFYGGCNDFVLNHVRAVKKVAFLHCDYRLCGADTPRNARQYAQFDAIAACSEGCAAAFRQANPLLADRVKVVYNCQRFDAIRQQAQDVPAVMDAGKINIVTVARLGREKGVPRAVEAISRLDGLRDQIHYYIVGDGVERQALLDAIRERKLEQTVTICGELENPYGCIQSGDLLLIPSLSEAAPLVIGEAACLGTPVLSTRTSSADEMITDTGFGWVCDNSVEGLRAGLENLLRSPEILAGKRRELKQKNFDNTLASDQFRRLVEESNNVGEVYDKEP